MKHLFTILAAILLASCASTKDSTTTVNAYQYKASYNPTTKTYGSDEAYNDKVYTGNDGGKVEDAALTYLQNASNYYADGYYIEQGKWKTWRTKSNGAIIYRNTVYHISDGTLTVMGYIYTDGKKLTNSQGDDIQSANTYIYSSLIKQDV